MGWVTLSLRKLTLKAEINQLNFQDTQLSRQIRGIHRHLSHDTSIFQADKAKELASAKEGYLEVRDRRPSVDSAEYEKWKVEYANAKEDYQAQKQDIEDYYDGVLEQLEEEANDQETIIQEQQATIEAQRDAMSAELESITEEIKNEIEQSAIKF